MKTIERADFHLFKMFWCSDTCSLQIIYLLPLHINDTFMYATPGVSFYYNIIYLESLCISKDEREMHAGAT